MLTPNELKRRALDFSREHADDTNEKSEAHDFWRDFFEIFGLTPKRIGVWEERAKTLRGTVGFIDFFWPGTILVEHKSKGRDLEEALKQALDYCATGGLKDTELPRFVVVCDFARFILLEPATGERSEFTLEELHENLHRFNFILGYEQRTYKDEDPVNIKAAELMGRLHDEIKRVGYAGHHLELFLVRLMFCFFSDDTGIFQKDQIADYLETRPREDGSDLGQCIAEIFRVLNTPPEKRQKNLPEDLAAFPYVNGNLFEEAEDAPYFDAASRQILLHCARFNWCSVSPAIFGSLFQSVMEAKERRSLGAHYTSEKNILKTVHGLFLDELQAEFERIQMRKIDQERLYKALLSRIASIRLLDPACGCGNFLILAYRELRRMEIKIHKELRALSHDKGLSLDVGLERGITVDHIYGIEIEEFPSQIARTALWIMDHLMNVELSAALGDYRPSIPLMVSPKIIQGNALRLDWKEMVKPSELSYILGNPPFIGSSYQNEEQKKDLHALFPNAKYLDYVTAWYKTAALYIQNTSIECAFVSTNSICQGEQVSALWSELFNEYNIKINFAHQTFKWSNEAKDNAAVYCIIVGFSLNDRKTKKLFQYASVDGEPVEVSCNNINAYLVDASNIIIKPRNSPLCGVPSMGRGSQPTDNGNLIFNELEYKEFISNEPKASVYIKRYMMGNEFLNNIKRYCLWLVDCPPNHLRNLPLTMKRVDAVKLFRSKSTKAATRKKADTPTLFDENHQPKNTYIGMPEVSSERRVYIPVGYLNPDIISGNKLYVIENTTAYHFGVITSLMHMSWTRYVCGRLEMRYCYSNTIVYNNFPWPKSPTEEQQGAVEKAAQAVLDARAQFPDSSLADLYDPLSMPPVLVKAHKALDAAVDKCYRKEPFKSELDRVEYLFTLYEKYTEGQTLGLETKSKGC
jgi:hypothetical protein